MSTKKKYVFEVTERKDFKMVKYPDFLSKTFKSKRKAEAAMLEFDIFPPGVTCGGSATISLRRSFDGD